MHRVPVQSSNIRSIGYDSATEQLEIEFHQGIVYLYFDVPKSLYLGLVSAHSKGSFLAQNIKESYVYKRM